MNLQSIRTIHHLYWFLIRNKEKSVNDIAYLFHAIEFNGNKGENDTFNKDFKMVRNPTGIYERW